MPARMSSASSALVTAPLALAFLALAGCDAVPMPPAASSGGSGVVPAEAAIAIRPAPEPLATVQEKQSPECLQLGRPDDRERPDYPAAAAKVRQEGWVRLRYDVSSGQVVNPEVMAASPPGLFDGAVLAWAQKLRYPAGGTATSCVMEYEYRLQAPGDAVAASSAESPAAPGPVPVPLPAPVPPPEPPASSPVPPYPIPPAPPGSGPTPPPGIPSPSPAPPPPMNG